VFGAVRKAVRLPPAEAMRPEPPASYRKALVERIGLGRWLGVSLRMALRNIERKPVNAALTCLALAFATGLLIVPSAFRDGIEYVLDYQWEWCSGTRLLSRSSNRQRRAQSRTFARCRASSSPSRTATHRSSCRTVG